jgi:hypothetical protein
MKENPCILFTEHLMLVLDDNRKKKSYRWGVVYRLKKDSFHRIVTLTMQSAVMGSNCSKFGLANKLTGDEIKEPTQPTHLLPRLLGAKKSSLYTWK